MSYAPALPAAREPKLGSSTRRLAGRGGDVAALAAYVSLWLLLFGRHALVDPGRLCSCVGNGDPAAYMWGLVWWPHALFHGLNPFVSHVIWTPAGVNVAAFGALVPAPSIAVAPFTELFGPIVGYNVLNLLGPVLAAWSAFRLCRYLTARWPASFIGGYIFGFSTYEAGQLLGHPNLIWVWLVPAAVHLVLLRLSERVSVRRFVVLMAGLICLQVFTSTEILLTMVLFGGCALALAYLFCRKLRGGIAALVRALLAAGTAAAVVSSPYLYYALSSRSTLSWRQIGNEYSADPLNYVLPTPVTWLGHGLVASVANSFNSLDGGLHGNFSESGAYVGIPLLCAVIAYLVGVRRSAHAKVLIAMLVLLFIASLGPFLHVAHAPAGEPINTIYHPAIPLPWWIVNHLPGLNQAASVRFSMYVFLVVGVTVALWLAQAQGSRRWRWLVIGVGVVMLLPNFSGSYWRGRPTDPQFFSTAVYRRYLHPGETALVLPYGYTGNSMLWQAQTHMYFNMTGGYVGQEIPPSYRTEPLVPTFLGQTGAGRINDLATALRSFISRRRVEVVIDASPGIDEWKLVLAFREGLHPISAGGVVLFNVPPAWYRRAAAT